jgi:hypothetical protein
MVGYGFCRTFPPDRPLSGHDGLDFQGGRPKYFGLILKNLREAYLKGVV